MGTHPIFESDFDCLTDFQRIKSDFVFRRAKKIWELGPGEGEKNRKI